jgi:hypothetical protein
LAVITHILSKAEVVAFGKVLTLPEIKQIIDKPGLKFVGFEVNAETRERYVRQFPDDPMATSLENWHEFEHANTNTFIGLYLFGCNACTIDDARADAGS